MEKLTMEKLYSFKEKCDTTECEAIHMKGAYVDPKVIGEGINSIMSKINCATLGIDELNAADRLLLTLLEAQDGYNF
jgi:hypothetical protein